MTHAVRGVVSRAKGQPVTLETIYVPDLGPGEALVRVQACGVCRTDLHYREGGINDDFPFLLGHEATGIVETVGPDITDITPMLIDLYLQGRLPLDKFVSEKIGLDDVEAAFAKMDRDEVLRSVVML